MENIQNQNIGKNITPKHFNIKCKSCKSKFNNFVKYSCVDDFMQWSCSNCNSKFKMYANDLQIKNPYLLNQENITLLSIFKEQNGENTYKRYGCFDNSTFKQILTDNI